MVKPGESDVRQAMVDGDIGAGMAFPFDFL